MIRCTLASIQKHQIRLKLLNSWTQKKIWQIMFHLCVQRKLTKFLLRSRDNLLSSCYGREMIHKVLFLAQSTLSKILQCVLSLADLAQCKLSLMLSTREDFTSWFESAKVATLVSFTRIFILLTKSVLFVDFHALMFLFVIYQCHFLNFSFLSAWNICLVFRQNPCFFFSKILQSFGLYHLMLRRSICT